VTGGRKRIGMGDKKDKKKHGTSKSKIPFEPPEAGKRRPSRPGTPETLDFKHEIPQVY
jgi:hypothetical protein